MGNIMRQSLTGLYYSGRERDLIPLGLLQAKTYMANNGIMKNML